LFNGWTNRETWALNLWLTNDQGLYELTRERVAQAVAAVRDEDDSEPTTPYLAQQAGEAVRDFYDELTDPSEGLMTAEQSLEMVRDIGSEYRVNWDEIGAYWVSDLDES
jgi:hypothetical protein